MVSIIIPTYNREKEIARAVYSILRQTYVHYEVIIVDDASTDNTKEVVEQIADKRIRYIRLEKNQGACHARNVGIQESQYDYIAFLDSDDEWMPNKLEVQMHKMLQSAEDVGMIYCRMGGNRRNKEERNIYPPYEWPDDIPLEGDIFHVLLWKNTIGTPTMLVRKKCLEQVGGFLESLHCLQDWELAIRIAKEWRIGFVDDVLVEVHKVANSISTNHGWHLVARCYIVSQYRKELKMAGLLGLVEGEIMEKARFHGVEEEISELLGRDFELGYHGAKKRSKIDEGVNVPQAASGERAKRMTNGNENVAGADKQLQEVTHIVRQIEKLRVNIDAKLQQKRLPEQQVLEVLADAMEGVDEITKIHPHNGIWAHFYQDARQGRVSHGFCDKIEEWQRETLNWVDHMESRRLIHDLQEEVQRQTEMIQKLLGNQNVRLGWYPQIDKEKISYAIEADHTVGVTSQKRSRQIIVSLTSYPDRMYDIKYSLYSLLHQSLKPDQVILWLAKEQFPGGEDDIAPSLLAMKENGLTIKWCEDLKSYKKLIPALEAYPEDIIVTADDDMYYAENWLELLYQSYLERPDCVHAHRAHRAQLSGDGFMPYSHWEKRIEPNEDTFSAFPTGGGGILYPPHVLYKDITDQELFMKLSPRADDIWFWAMCILNATKIKVIKNGIKNPMAVNWAREIGLRGETTLFSGNSSVEGNDVYLRNVLSQYPALLDILRTEQAGSGVKNVGGLDRINIQDGLDGTNSVSRIDRTNNVGWNGSAQYWEKRYAEGGASGAGSYSNLADFKARVLNQFVKEQNLQTVIEWGCGDGNQLKLAMYPQYVGYDVSQSAIARCREIFRGDTTKEFIWSGGAGFADMRKGDLALSLDVIYHLVEDEIFELYMKRLFASSDRFVCIYSCNFDKESALHVKCRRFTDYIDRNISGWELVKVIPNEYPYDERNPHHTSWSDFYIYQKSADNGQ